MPMFMTGVSGHDQGVVGYTSFYVITVYLTKNVFAHEFKTSLWEGVLDKTLCDQVCKKLLGLEFLN